MNIEVGKTYHVNHRRKGQFDLLVTKVDDEWVTGDITSGVARYLNRDHRMDGDEITINADLATFTETEETAK